MSAHTAISSNQLPDPERHLSPDAPDDDTAVPTAAPKPCVGWLVARHGDSRDREFSGRSGWTNSVVETTVLSGKWDQWSASEPRLSGLASLEEALAGWRRRDPRCYQVVAGLTALGSRRGGDDDDAALAVVALLEDGVTRMAARLRDLCEIGDARTTVWEEVKAAEPQLGARAARYLLQRARQRLTRPAAGMVARVETVSLEPRTQYMFQAQGRATTGEPGGGYLQHRDLLLAVPAVEDSSADLADLLTWARNTGVIDEEDVDLIVELLAAENAGLPREQAQRLIGQRRGVAMRTIRRRRDATTARLRDSAPSYLAAIA